MPLEGVTKAKYLLNTAIAAVEAGRYGDAVRQLKVAIQYDPQLAAAHFALGRLYSELGRLEPAVECLLAAIRLDPELEGAHLQLAQAYSLLGRTEEAVEECRKAVALDPELASGYTMLGDLLASLGRTDEAVDAYRAALPTNPQAAAARFKLANLYIGRDASTEAYRQSAEAMSLHPHLASSRMRLGDLYVKRGAYDEALREYQAALKTELADVGGIHYRIGSVYFALDRFDDAAAQFEKAVEHGAELAACQYKIGISRFAQGRYEEALRAYEAALARLPFSSTLRFNQGEAFRALERLEEAAGAYRSALAIDPKLQAAQDRLDLVEGRPAPLEARKLLWIPLAPTEERHALLHCSGPDDERMLIAARGVERIEEMPVSAIVMHEGLPHVPYEGSLLPLIDVARMLPNKRRTARHPEYYQRALTKTSFPMIVYGEGERRVGLVINEIHGRIEESYVLRGVPSRQGVRFTTLLGGRVAEVLDISSIVEAATRPGGKSGRPDAVLGADNIFGSVPMQFFGE